MEPTAGLILAAGFGTRFGGQKLLAQIDDKPMLQHVLDLAADADLARVVVVLGNDAEEIEAACTWRDELRIRNYSPENGLSSSIKSGLWTLLRLKSVQRVVVLLGDQPFLTVAQLDAVLTARGQFVVPRYGGAPGESILEVFTSLDELKGKVPPELFDMVSRSARGPAAIEDLDI